MHLVSWNVNGFRAVLAKGFDDIFSSFGADVFCLQETKLSHGQVSKEFEGYSSYWNYAEKKGYSGTAVFTRHAPLAVTRGIGVPEFDTEGRVLCLEFPSFYLVNVYVPNSQSELKRLDFRLRWEDAFRSYVCALDRLKPVVICGDLNVAHREIDLKNPAANRSNPGFTDQERDAFSALLDAGFVDTFRSLHPAEQAFSWWSYRYSARAKNIGWRIDYFLVSSRLASRLAGAAIHADVLGSDHCPVSVTFDPAD